jgi:D-3-phosphoglycerate dehydrogenase
MLKNNTLILDFDSTIIQGETLDILAEIALENCANKNEIVSEIAKITALGMEGKLDFAESLVKRLNLFKCNKTHIEITINELSNLVSKSIKNNKQFLSKNSSNIFIISGGFTEIIAPIALDLGLKKENIFANTFLYDKDQNIIGVDKENFLAQSKGKIKAAKSLNIDSSNAHAIGDGYTDLELKLEGVVSKFFCYIETIERKKVCSQADFVIKNFDEYLQIINTI